MRLDHLLSNFFSLCEKILELQVLSAELGYFNLNFNGSVSPAKFINASKGLPIYCVKCKVKGVMNQGITHYTFPAKLFHSWRDPAVDFVMPCGKTLHLNSGP